jgi:FkbM family methyltransferase
MADMIELQIPGLTPGLTMQVHGSGDRMISSTLRRDRCWEPYETALTLKHLQPGEVYVDVGANIGYYTLVAAQRVGVQGKVFAYEPDPDNFALLEANVLLNRLPQVQVFPYALYDKNVEGKLFLSDDNFGDHRIYAAENRPSRDIRLLQGDEHLRPLTGKIDFLKIDTQGSEYFVVKGLWQLIMQNRQWLRIILEFCPFGIRQSGASGSEFVRLLDTLGMQYHIIDHQQQCLIPAESYHFAEWVNRMADEPQNEGFINVLITPQDYLVN